MEFNDERMTERQGQINISSYIFWEWLLLIQNDIAKSKYA